MKSIISLSFLLIITVCFAAHPWEPQAKTGGWLTHHEQLVNMTLEHKKNIKVVFLGDSITAGWAGNGKAVWNKYYAPRGAYNYGIGGDTTQNVLYRIQNHEFDDISPKVLVLKIGTNNIGGNTEEDVAHGVKEIVTELRAKLPETKILLLAMLPRTPLELDNKVHRSNAIIAKNGDDQHVFYLDMRSSFETAPGVEKPGLYVEGLHLTAKGYEVWYEAMEPLFKKLYE